METEIGVSKRVAFKGYPFGKKVVVTYLISAFDR